MNKREQKAIYVIFLSLLLDLIAFAMILPLFPSLMEFYKTNDSSGVYNYLFQKVQHFQVAVGAPDKYSSVLFGGFLGSMFSFLQFIASPIVGALSDVYGRKPLMLLCLAGIVVSYICWALSHNFAIFILARFIGGISKGNTSLAMAIITDVSGTEKRGKGMALVGISFSLGFIIGPMIGALFAVFSNKTTVYWFALPACFAVFLAIIDLIVVQCIFEETLPKNKRANKIMSSLSNASKVLNVSKIFSFHVVKGMSIKQAESLRGIGLIYFTYMILFSGLEFNITFLLFHKFGYNSMDQAKMLLLTGCIMAFLQGTVVRRLTSRLLQSSAVFALFLISPAFIMIGLSANTIMLTVGLIMFSISTAFVVTCLTTMVSEYGKCDQKGTVLGLFRSLGALARALGPIIGSIAFWSFGAQISYTVGGLLLLYPAYRLQKLQIEQ